MKIFKIGVNLHSVGVWEFRSLGVWTIALPLATQAGRQLSIVNFQFYWKPSPLGESERYLVPPLIGEVRKGLLSSQLNKKFSP